MLDADRSQVATHDPQAAPAPAPEFPRPPEADAWPDINEIRVLTRSPGSPIYRGIINHLEAGRDGAPPRVIVLCAHARAEDLENAPAYVEIRKALREQVIGMSEFALIGDEMLWRGARLSRSPLEIDDGQMFAAHEAPEARDISRLTFDTIWTTASPIRASIWSAAGLIEFTRRALFNVWTR